MTDAAIDMDRFKSKRQPTKRQPTTAAPPSDEGAEVCNAPTRLPRQQGYWAPVPLEVPTDRRHWGLIPARFRLLLYIQIKSRRGEKPITPDQCYGGGDRAEPEAEVGLVRCPGGGGLRHSGTDREKEPHRCKPFVVDRGAIAL
jgi:hypothetical protein